MASAVELIRVSNLSDVAEYAYAATVSREARLIFLAGACPLNEDGATAAIGDYAGQARVCVENLTRALAAAGFPHVEAHAVAVHGAVHVPCSNVNVLFHFVAGDVGRAGAGHVNVALVRADFGGRGSFRPQFELKIFERRQQAGFHQCVEGVLHRVFVVVYPKVLNDLFRVESLFRIVLKQL